MAQRKFFRTTFRGFSKEDVLAHIDTLHAKQQEELNEMKAQVELAQEQSAAARAEADAVIALPAEQMAELEKLRQAVAAYELETQQLKKQLEESNQAVAALWEQQRHLQEYIAHADAFIADAQALSEQLAARVKAYGEQPITALDTANPAPAVEESADTPDESTDKPAAKTAMADWLY